MTEQRARAHQFVTRGFSVFPVPVPGDGVPGDGKTPIVKWSPYQTRFPTAHELDAWFNYKPMNLAIVTGAISGVVVVDLDDIDACHWWTRHRCYTPWQTRTARGFHLFYRHPGIAVANRAHVDTGSGRKQLDVRGDGGFVIGPGSIHASGVLYTEAGDWREPREAVPMFHVDWMARPSRAIPAAAVRPHVHEDVIDRARAYLAAIPRPEIGSGSDAATLYAACRLVRGFGVSAVDAESLLWEWAGNRDGWTRAWVAKKVAHAERYGTEPIGGLR